MSTPFKVRGIGASKHESAQFAGLSLFLPGENDKGQKVYAFFRCELHLVEGFRAKILIENNILAPEDFIFDVKLGHAFVGSCGVKTTVRAGQRVQFLRRKLLAETDRVVPPRSEAMVPLKPILLPDDRDFLFHPVVQANLTLFAHLIDHETTKVLVRNTFDRPLRISRRQRLGQVVNIRYNNCFLVEPESALQAAAFPPKALPFFEHEYSCTPALTDPSMKTRLDNDVRVYEDEQAVTLLS